MTSLARAFPTFRERLLLAIIIAAWLILAAVVARVYFVVDDWWALERILDHGVGWSFDPTLPGRVFYRPLLHDLYFRILSALFGLRPEPFHLFNMLCFAGDIFLIYVIGKRVTGRSLAAMIAAFFYATAPLNYMPITFISGAQEVCTQFLALLAVYFFVSADRGPGPGPGEKIFSRVAGPLLYALALLCKETIVWVPIWLWIFELVSAVKGQDKIAGAVRARLLHHLPFDLLMVGYLAFRFRYLPPPATGEYRMSWFGVHVFHRLEEFMFAVSQGLGLPPVPAADHYFLYSAAGGLALMIFAIGCFRTRRVPVPVVLGLTWFGGGMVLFLPFTSRSFEYFISFASIGLFWTLGYGLEILLDRLRPATSRAVFIGYLSLVLLVSGYGYYQRETYGFTNVAARATRAMHDGITARHPTFPPHSKIIVLSELRMKGDASHFGLRALYRDPSLQVFTDEQAYQITKTPEGFALSPRPDFNYLGVFVFAYSKRDGFMEINVGPDGSLPLSVKANH